MVTNRRKIALRIAILYVILGCTYFLLWHFVISPSGYINLVVNVLFYISLPAILAAPGVVFEIVAQVVSTRLKPIEESEESSD